jgi:lysophospholipase L1-like esterase
VLVGLLVGVDLLLSLGRWVPPDDPLLFFARTQERTIDPFVSVADGVLEIRSDWVNDGLGLRGRWGKRAGRQFLMPGFRPARVESPKPPGTLRIFAIGGSTTYGLFVGAGDAFGAVLEARLQERVPDRRVEVINLGCPGFASDRVAALLPTLLGLEPDLIIVLTGHNEMLGGHAGLASELSPALALRVRLLRASTLFAWWNHLLGSTLRRVETEQVREEVAALEAGQIPTYVPEAVPASVREAPRPEFRRRAVERLTRNVGAMLSSAEASGVPLIVAIPAANLLSPPGLSAHAEGFEETVAFEVAMRAGRALLESEKADRALERFDEAVRLSRSHAATHFARAEALRALDREDEARDAYRLAVDLDVRTHRITRELEEALVEALRAHGVPSVDLRPLFQGALDEGTAEALFVDHVHPTAEGHVRIAEALLREMAAKYGLR